MHRRLPHRVACWNIQLDYRESEMIRSFFPFLSVPPVLFPVHYERNDVRQYGGILSSMVLQMHHCDVDAFLRASNAAEFNQKS